MKKQIIAIVLAILIGLTVLMLFYGKTLFLSLILPTNRDPIMMPTFACEDLAIDDPAPVDSSFKIHVFTVGRNKLTQVETGKPEEWVPIMSYVIERKENLIVIDPGPDRQRIGHDREYNGLINWWVNPIDLRQDEDLPSQMIKAGLKPERVTTVILTHGHSDHTGNLDAFPNATVVMTAKDKNEVMTKGSRIGGKPDELNAAKAWREIDFTGTPQMGPFAHGLDLLGDQFASLLETDGHTSGQLSVLLNTTAGMFFFPGDALALWSDFEDRYAMPGQADRSRFLYHLAEINCLKKNQSNLIIFPGHDSPVGALPNKYVLVH